MKEVTDFFNQISKKARGFQELCSCWSLVVLLLSNAFQRKDSMCKSFRQNSNKNQHKLCTAGQSCI